MPRELDPQREIGFLLVHDYGRVSLEASWEVTQRHAPAMIEIITH
jgi:hypothetical protein